ncbi:MAG: hypothetical protein JKY46_07715 [Robiginitomaculum sp.]|nr:hypothetical protein [Robiginitomaculum sp.]
MRKWINLVLFILIFLGAAVIMVERKAANGNTNPKEIVIEVDNVLDL